MNFCSDNTTAVCPEILDHMGRVNGGFAMPYGNDDVTARVCTTLKQVFDCDLAAFPVATGTAANVLSLSVYTPSHGSILCHEESHINVDECGAPELYTGGAKLVPFKGGGSKLAPQELENYLNQGWAGNVHQVQPTMISITQASESGTVYSIDEVKAISAICKAHNLKLHMDGARFANALVHLGCSPADITWKAGVDVLSFGATKNGALGAEAAVFFDPTMADLAGFKRKRGGHLFSKMRFLSAQLEAYLADDLWLKNAKHANHTATRLCEGLLAGGIQLRYPVEANELFILIAKPVAEKLQNQGFAFYSYPLGGANCYRLVTAWNTDPKDVESFIETAVGAAKKGT